MLRKLHLAFRVSFELDFFNQVFISIYCNDVRLKCLLTLIIVSALVIFNRTPIERRAAVISFYRKPISWSLWKRRVLTCVPRRLPGRVLEWCFPMMGRRQRWAALIIEFCRLCPNFTMGQSSLICLSGRVACVNEILQLV